MFLEKFFVFDFRFTIHLNLRWQEFNRLSNGQKDCLELQRLSFRRATVRGSIIYIPNNIFQGGDQRYGNFCLACFFMYFLSIFPKNSTKLWFFSKTPSYLCCKSPALKRGSLYFQQQSRFAILINASLGNSF